MTGKTPKDFRPLFSEINPLFASNKETSNVISIRVRMSDSIDDAILKRSVETGMNRYPYFRVELCKSNGLWGFIENRRPVTVSHSKLRRADSRVFSHGRSA